MTGTEAQARIGQPLVIDYDKIELWGSWVGEIVVGEAGELVLEELGRRDPEYIEDACDWLLERVGRERAIDAVAQGLQDRLVRLFHGTRLGELELAQIREHGLRPLHLADRQRTLIEAFRGHERWATVECRLAEALELFGPKARAGRREDGFVHVCFSRSGLLTGCNHYLTHGAEVDGHIAHHLFGDESGHGLLSEHRRPYVISFEVPFDTAAQGSHSLHQLDVGRELLAEKLLGAWAFWTAHPEFRITTQRDCTAAKIPGVVGPERLIIEPIDDAELDPD